MEVVINGRGFYPPSREENGLEGENNQAPKELAVQNGYRLLKIIINLTDEELAFLLPSGTSRILSTELSSEYYSSIQADFIVLLEEEAVEGSFEEGRLHYSFRAPEPATVNTVGHYNSLATVSWSRIGKEMNSSITMDEGVTLDIYFDGAYKMESFDALLLEIQTEDDNYYTRHFRETVKQPDGYLKQLENEN